MVRGAARRVAAAATRQQAWTGDDLAEADPAAWAALRRELGERRQRRVEHRRFREDPDKYLKDLEEQFHQSGLPA